MTAIKALFQLGLTRTALYGLYRIGLAAGHYARIEKRRLKSMHGTVYAPPRPLFTPAPPQQTLAVLGKEGLRRLRSQADEILAGKVRLFGGPPADLKLSLDPPLRHWMDYETGRAGEGHIVGLPVKDIKYLWEPARFGWATLLARAYYLTGGEKYAEGFWRLFEAFNAANPPYLGSHWSSAQEAALRILCWTFTWHLLREAKATTATRTRALAQAIALHAARIPPTLVYARAQDNNHLLSEAAGLYTAGLFLAGQPHAAGWRRIGRKWLEWCWKRQIDAYGEYVQHSTNYHRLMLQLALWVNLLAKGSGDSFSRRAKENLSLAVHWLYSMLDPDSGCVPNLGANDGAYVLPLTVCPFEDHRPVLQAAARAFLDYSLPPGAWDEMAVWFGLPASPRFLEPGRYLGDHLYARDSWGCLRAVRRYRSRPSHADQLHFDLWWCGLNVAQDAGTHLYNAAPPWDNSLTSTLVHNTVSVNGREQMTRAGRFLYLDWVNAHYRADLEAEERVVQRVTADHDGYRRFGVRHLRSVSLYEDERWVIEDALVLLRAKRTKKALTFRLHWLLPDWKWELEQRGTTCRLRMKSPHGWVTLTVNSPLETVSLVRAGEVLRGEREVRPWEGWASPTYGCKVPALSFVVEVTSTQSTSFISEFIFPPR